MKERIPPSLRQLAAALPYPLYVVGGSVRDYLAGHFELIADWDLASPAPEDAVEQAARACGWEVRAVYRNTGTVKLTDAGGTGYEFTRFRSDRYVRGLHAPAAIEFTDDIVRDARRRDFCANAVYYEVGTGTFCDPLGGIPDIRDRKLRTVAPAEKVFGEDGLRLARLARLAAQTGFAPDEECLAGAAKHRALIRDIAAERVFSELDQLLHADRKAGGAWGPYRGLGILRDTGVLNEIMPELAAGEGMAQRADFHRYDVLEHSFRCVRYAAPEIRWAALLHDVGKSYCFMRDGNFHAHPEEGARLAEHILDRLKAPKKLTERTKRLVSLHMRDFDMKMKESKVRRDILEQYDLLPELFALRRADFSACKDDLSPAPGVVRWQGVLAKMRAEGVPFSLRELAVNGADLTALGIRGGRVGETLKELLLYCAQDGARNTRAALLKHLKNMTKETP